MKSQSVIAAVICCASMSCGSDSADKKPISENPALLGEVDSDCGQHVWTRGLTFEGTGLTGSLQEDGAWTKLSGSLGSSKNLTIGGAKSSGAAPGNPDCAILEAAVRSGMMEWTAEAPLLSGFTADEQVNQGDFASYEIAFNFATDENLPFATVAAVEAYLAGDQEPIAVTGLNFEMGFATGALVSNSSLVQSTSQVELNCAQPFTYKIDRVTSVNEDGRLCKANARDDGYTCYLASIQFTADECQFTAKNAKMFHPGGGILEFDLSGAIYQTSDDEGRDYFEMAVNAVKF